jgi:hypothetical protein
MLNCGECLVNKVKLVSLVDMICPECNADYRDSNEYTVAAVVPSPQRNSAPKAGSINLSPGVMERLDGEITAESSAAIKMKPAAAMPVIFEEKVLTAVARLRALANDADYQGSGGQWLARRVEAVCADLMSEKLSDEDVSRLKVADVLVAKLAEMVQTDTEFPMEFPPVLSIGGTDAVAA